MIFAPLFTLALGNDPTKFGYRVNGNQCCISGRDKIIRPTAESCTSANITTRAQCENWANADPGLRQSYWRCQWDVNAGTCVDYCGQSDRVVHDKHCRR